MAIDAKKAVENAIQYYRDVSGERANMTVEEVELDGNSWVITLGVVDSYTIGIPGIKPTNYKQFRINSSTGEVVSMKIRKV